MVSKLNLKKIKKFVQSNNEYQHFKLIAGFFSRKDLGNWKEKEGVRIKEIELYVNALTDENKEKYINIILQVNHLISDKNLNLHYFQIFLNRICSKSPELIYELLENKQNEFKQELLQIFSYEIFKSKLKDKMICKLIEWTQQNRNLNISLKTLLIEQKPDLEIIEMIIQKACINSESKFLNEITFYLLQIPDAKNLFLSVLQKLTELQNSEWLIKSYLQEFPVLETLEKEEIILLLKNLEFVNYIDYSVEILLSKIAENYPKEVMNFFYNRIKTNNMDDIFNHFDKLAIVLKKNEKIIVDEIFKWDEGYFLLSSKLLNSLIPSIENSSLKEKIIMLINKGKDIDLARVIEILKSYRLNNSVKNICKEIIIKFYPKYKDSLFHILSETGEVSGWDGFSTAYQKKREDIKILENEQHENVKKFVKDYKKYLDKQITFYQKEEKEDIKARELDFES